MLVGEREQRRRHGNAERLGSLEIDDQLVLGRLLYRKIGGLLAPEDAIDIAGGSAMLIEEIGAVGDETAGGSEIPCAVAGKRCFAASAILGRLAQALRVDPCDLIRGPWSRKVSARVRLCLRFNDRQRFVLGSSAVHDQRFAKRGRTLVSGEMYPVSRNNCRLSLL